MEGAGQMTLAEHIARELAEYEDLLIRLEAMRTDPGPRKTLVELGAGVWADASIDSVQNVTIEIGLGVCLDMPVDEGVEFTKSKIASLHRRLSSVTRWHVQAVQ